MDPLDWNQLGKMVETVEEGQLQTLLNVMDYLDPFQSESRPGHRTESAWVTLVNDLYRQWDKGSMTFPLLLSLSAAFSTIGHGIFLDRLCAVEIGGTVLQWSLSYLQGRVHRVALRECFSSHGCAVGCHRALFCFQCYLISTQSHWERSLDVWEQGAFSMMMMRSSVSP